MGRILTGGASVPERGNREILDALNNVAATYHVDPAAIAAVIHTESRWDTRCVTGSYIGLTQVGSELPDFMKITREEFLALSAPAQIKAYGTWLSKSLYDFSGKVAKHGMKVASAPIARQAAVLQAMQFAPNATKWKIAFARGDYSVPSTPHKQARFLGDTSIHDMEAYYAAFFRQHPPTYSGDAAEMEAVDAPQPTAPAAAKWAGEDAPDGDDATRVPVLIEIGSDVERCDAVRAKARRAMIKIYGRPTLHNACAATLSLFLKEAGIAVPITYGAGALARLLEKERGWSRIPIKQQRAGDVGVCRDDDTSIPGADHVFLVVKRVDHDLMSIADNQDSHSPHPRYASGKGGKTPVNYFLRASSADDAGVADGLPYSFEDEVVTVDEQTDNLVAKFDADGKALD